MKQGSMLMSTVMVVDDMPVIRETVAKLLKHEGFDAVCAANGREALEAVRRSPPDLVLLDMMMPEMNGMEFLEQLRADPKIGNIPVIVMTAFSDDEWQRKALQLGISEYLVKARCSISQMISSVKQHVAGGQAKQ
jgi:CheY-like chemotaxis protein